jgi:hypothetical protein
MRVSRWQAPGLRRATAGARESGFRLTSLPRKMYIGAQFSMKGEVEFACAGDASARCLPLHQSVSAV